MGIRSGAAKRASAFIGMGMSAEDYINSGSRGALRLLDKASKVKKGKPMLTGTEVTKRAINMRRAQIAKRGVAGASMLGGVGMMRNRNGSRGGFQGPRGSGRYA